MDLGLGPFSFRRERPANARAVTVELARDGAQTALCAGTPAQTQWGVLAGGRSG
jgi:hypothetical protein